jgi:sugar lactone lactonase YvrE
MARKILWVTILIHFGFHVAVVQAHVGTGIDLDREGRIYFTDTLHNRIWRLDPDGRLTSLAQGMHLDFLIVADDGNLYLIDDHAWKLTPQGQLTQIDRATDIPRTIAWAFAIDDRGNVIGPQVRFGKVNAATVSPDGSVYALDQEQHIRKVSPDGTVSVLAGSEEATYAEGGEEKRQRTMGLAVDDENNVYVANYWRRSVFKLSPQGKVNAVLNSSWPWVPVASPPQPAMSMLSSAWAILMDQARPSKCPHWQTVSAVLEFERSRGTEQSQRFPLSKEKEAWPSSSLHPLSSS